MLFTVILSFLCLLILAILFKCSYVVLDMSSYISSHVTLVGLIWVLSPIVEPKFPGAGVSLLEGGEVQVSPSAGTAGSPAHGAQGLGPGPSGWGQVPGGLVFRG